MSSNAAPLFQILWGGAAALGLSSSPVAAQDDAPITSEEQTSDLAQQGDDDDLPPLINLAITVPRGEVSEAQIQDCENRADAGQISGEIVVCRQLGENPDNLYSSREEARKRYAEETKFKGATPTPNLVPTCHSKGNPFGCVGIGSAPPPALLIDVEALPEAPPGSDADRIARGLPPLGQDEPSEEEIRDRRRELGLSTPPIESEPD